MKFKKNSILKKIIIVSVLLLVIINIFRYAAYFKRDEKSGISVIIQNETNINLNNEIYVDDSGNVYLSEDDIKKFFDEDLYFEENSENLRKYISICQNKILEITEGENNMYVNGVFTKIKGKVIKRDEIYYFPISDFSEVYNIDVEYLKDMKRLNIDKLSEKKTTAVVNRDMNLKYKMTDISKNIGKVYQGEIVTILQDMNSKWVKVKTKDYSVGYLKKSKLINIAQERDSLEFNVEEFGKFDLENDIIIEINRDNYSNFNKEIVDFDSRTKIIKEINDKLKKEISSSSDLNKNIAVKISFEEISNSENYYRFLKELKAYVNSNGCYLIVEKNSALDEDKLKNISNIII